MNINKTYTSKIHPETNEITNIAGVNFIRILFSAWGLICAYDILLRAVGRYSPICGLAIEPY
jgi:hypothetical protein